MMGTYSWNLEHGHAQNMQIPNCSMSKKKLIPDMIFL